ncbi:MAG: hypothetical protein HY688_00860, partial [Chloroflexi bacterium]|nr:hypothetical protein [Chloroflexota bacterium]
LRLRLLREASLPPHLTTLYLLVATLRAEPPLALALAPGARIPLSGGRLYAEEQLTGHLLPTVQWSNELETAMASLAPEAPPTWRGARPYLQLLLGDTEEMDEGEAADHLQARRALLADARAQIEALGQEMGSPRESLHLLAAMRPLDTILEARHPADLLARVREAYPTVSEVAEAATAFRRVEEMARIAPAVGSAWRYLLGAIPAGEDTELALDRETILARMELGPLLAAPELWPSVAEAFAAYRARYIQRYLEAHRARSMMRAALHQRLEEAAPKVAALERLNSIRGLGPPLVPELPGPYTALLQQTGPCPVRDLAASLQQSPWCPDCAIVLGDKPPSEEVAAVLRRLGRALRDQQRRLASQAVRQVLARGGVDRLDRFLQAIQASDVATLTSLLDDSLVAFIEAFLQASEVHTPQRSILERLHERYPTVGPGEVNLAAAELVRLLRQELEEAQRQAPAQRSVRVALR